jgi:hypothetical protein
VSGKLERDDDDVQRGEPMSCEVNTQWFERAYEDHYDNLKAEGKSDEEIEKFINDLFYNSAEY